LPPMEKAFLTVIVTALAVLVAAASALVVLH
jgi:hypothetical protein